MINLGKLPYKTIGYCGTCKKEFGEANPDYLGCRIECRPKDLARVIFNDDVAKWWLRIEAFLWKWQIQYSPFAIFRLIAQWMNNKWRDCTKYYVKRMKSPCITRFFLWFDTKFTASKWPALFCYNKPFQAGHYLSLNFFIIIIALFVEGHNRPICLTLECIIYSVVESILVLLLIWRAFDILITNTSITFTSRTPVNPLRSVVFTILAFIQIVLIYAYVYGALCDMNFMKSKAGCRSIMDAIYFSFGTIATVGYGKLIPLHPIGQLFIISELLYGLFFVVIILAQVGSWASISKVEMGSYQWDDIMIADSRSGVDQP
jgi:hypothetical protein